jgi:hypothetical protein
VFSREYKLEWVYQRSVEGIWLLVIQTLDFKLKMINSVSICFLLLSISIAINIKLLFFNSISQNNSTRNLNPTVKNTIELFPNLFHTVDKIEIEQYSIDENRERSEISFALASKFSELEGEGRNGWLWLLASLDLCRSNIKALYNTINNYNDLYSGFSKLAYSEFIASEQFLTAEEKSIVSSSIELDKHETEFDSLSSSILSHPELPSPCTTAAFSSMLMSWRLAMNDELREAVTSRVVREYLSLKGGDTHSALSDTDLNHEFYRAQMGRMEEGGEYWGGFEGVAGFRGLVGAMRRAAFEFLARHNFSSEAALRKASHPLVVWASVHTENSVHQPHVTDDGMVDPLPCPLPHFIFLLY